MKEYIIELSSDDKNALSIIAKAYNLHELIRCKDCKFMYEDDVFQCAIKNGYFPVHEEWYCADGEAKT